MNDKKLNLILIFGGKSEEHDVSCLSVYNVLSSVNKEKYNITTIGITKDGKWLLFEGTPEKIKDGTWENDCKEAGICPNDGFYYKEDGKQILIPCDAVFPVVHGDYCEDGKLQGLFDMCGIKYVGPGTASSAVCMDKYLTKAVIATTGIPQASFTIISRASFNSDKESELNQVKEKFSFPVFVKPANAGSSVGASKVPDFDSLENAINEALKYDKKVLVEEYIKGREIEVAVMGNESPVASVCGEIDPGYDFYDYDTKYNNSTASYFIPARISDKCSAIVREYALKIYTVLDCRCLSRVDFFVDENENIIFNEINTLPGFTSISMYPSLFMHGGMSYSEIIDSLIALCLE